MPELLEAKFLNIMKLRVKDVMLWAVRALDDSYENTPEAL